MDPQVLWHLEIRKKRRIQIRWLRLVTGQLLGSEPGECGCHMTCRKSRNNDCSHGSHSLLKRMKILKNQFNYISRLTFRLLVPGNFDSRNREQIKVLLMHHYLSFLHVLPAVSSAYTSFHPLSLWWIPTHDSRSCSKV